MKTATIINFSTLLNPNNHSAISQIQSIKKSKTELALWSSIPETNKRSYYSIGNNEFNETVAPIIKIDYFTGTSPPNLREA